jgi:diguanylate cyclase (GGDEF)-like protein
MITTAEDGAQAWEILASDNPPPLAILDWVMPSLTGPEVCRRVRETRREPYTYLLLLTSKHTKDEIVEGMDAGADDYVVKPWDEHELKVRLRAGKRIIDLQTDLLLAREELRERANKDLLTMLPNRAAIDAVLEQEFARSGRDGATVGVILLDIDHFKRINDTYGHFAGDAVLRETAANLRANIRTYDQVGRYGGEEFLIVLPHSDLEQATLQAERLRTLLQSRSTMIEGAKLQVTASFGVTVADGQTGTPDLFVRVADEALYKAKAEGRNRVCTLTLEQSTQKPEHRAE